MHNFKSQFHFTYSQREEIFFSRNFFYPEKHFFYNLLAYIYLVTTHVKSNAKKIIFCHLYDINEIGFCAKL